jgi:hypothetical protein
MNIDWTCSFDVWSAPCAPKFTYTRLDDPNQPFSNGFNFRYANYYSYPDANGVITQYRDLIKVFGIRLSFLMTGVGKRFSIVPLLVCKSSTIAHCVAFAIDLACCSACCCMLLCVAKYWFGLGSTCARYCDLRSVGVVCVPTKAQVRACQIQEHQARRLDQLHRCVQ